MNLLGVEPQIIERLRARLADNVRVLARADLDQALTLRQLVAPAVYVIHQGARVTESRPDGRAVRLAQRWLCLVVAKNLTDLVSGAHARADAGALADAVLAALMGWRPEACSAPLSLSDVPDTDYLSGYQLIPLVFATELVRKADPD